MNIISSVGIIMVNKQVMSSSSYNFRFATTLTGFHFTVTALVGWISNATGYSASKHVPLWDLLWFSIVVNLLITGLNFSLMLNSVGFYQISKLSMILVVCVMEWILHNKNYSGRVMMAVFVVALGVAVSTVTDVDIDLKGFLCAFVVVFCSSLQQIKKKVVAQRKRTRPTESTHLEEIFLVAFENKGDASSYLFNHGMQDVVVKVLTDQDFHEDQLNDFLREER